MKSFLFLFLLLHLSKNDVDEHIYVLSDNVVFDLFKFVFKGA